MIRVQFNEVALLNQAATLTPDAVTVVFGLGAEILQELRELDRAPLITDVSEDFFDVQEPHGLVSHLDKATCLAESKSLPNA